MPKATLYDTTGLRASPKANQEYRDSEGFMMVQIPSKKRKALNKRHAPKGNKALSERGRTADASNGAEEDNFG